MSQKQDKLNTQKAGVFSAERTYTIEPKGSKQNRAYLKFVGSEDTGEVLEALWVIA